MDLVDELRLLKSQILAPGAGEQAFRTWTNVKDRLSPSQRVRILIAWNSYLRTEQASFVIETIDRIVCSLKR